MGKTCKFMCVLFLFFFFVLNYEGKKKLRLFVAKLFVVV